jgi:hypothetical protein
MVDTTKYEDMPITKVVAQFLDDLEWPGDIYVSDDRAISKYETKMEVEHQGYRLFLEVNERSEIFDVYMYPPFSVPKERVNATVKILNRINGEHLRLGRLVTLENGDSDVIQFKCGIDVEGGSLAVGQIYTIVSICDSLRRFHHLLSALAFTKISEDELWEEFVEEDEKSA